VFFGANLAFSKDILKTKEHFHSTSAMYSIQKRMMETFLPGVVSSYSEMQWREAPYHSPIVSTKQKTKRTTKRNQQDSEGDYQG
jgi:hypothetical protein